MTLRGVIREVQAAQRRAEREEKRRQRELEKRIREAEKLAEHEQAVLEVDEFLNYIDVISSIHKDCGFVWDWEEVWRSKSPAEPDKVNRRQLGAQQRIDSYKPSFFDKLLKRTEVKKDELNEELETAITEDNYEYQDSVEDYEDAYSEWEKLRELASRILKGDTDAYLEAIQEAEPFEEIYEYGSSFNTNVISKDIIEVLFQVNDEQVIPKETKTVLKTGKLSVKNMTKTRYYELYQDYVCGSTMRVARELFALLPIKRVLVTATCKMLNTSTGHKEEKPILSVIMPRDTIEELNFQMIDPSDSMTNFVHNMKF
ncbi:hypothetical protein KA005_81435, partial [bacterium]|nr:hypothetical protein [bacterium]